jgi:hypothetical protein
MRESVFAAVMMFFFLFAPCAVGAETPLSLAGFTLGRPVAEAAGRLRMDTSLPIRYQESMQEAEIKPIPGYKSGLVAYGTCLESNPVLRVKLKYADGSTEFFERLLESFKRRFGDPHEYQGDAFRIFISWKWSFTDRGGNRISLTLQHNQRDEDEKIGNAVKLTLVNRFEEEQRCFEQRQADGGEGLRRRRLEQSPAGPLQWELLIPN